MNPDNYYYLMEVGCPACGEVNRVVEERGYAVPLDHAVHVHASHCTHCGHNVEADDESWDPRADYEIESVLPTDPQQE